MRVNLLVVNLTVEIPDQIAERLSAAGGDLSRQVLEAYGLEQYKAGHLTEYELQTILGFGTRYELDGFLKSHGVMMDSTFEEVMQEVETLKRLGF